MIQTVFAQGGPARNGQSWEPEESFSHICALSTLEPFCCVLPALTGIMNPQAQSSEEGNTVNEVV